MGSGCFRDPGPPEFLGLGVFGLGLRQGPGFRVYGLGFSLGRWWGSRGVGWWGVVSWGVVSWWVGVVVGSGRGGSGLGSSVLKVLKARCRPEFLGLLGIRHTLTTEPFKPQTRISPTPKPPKPPKPPQTPLNPPKPPQPPKPPGHPKHPKPPNPLKLIPPESGVLTPFAAV